MGICSSKETTSRNFDKGYESFWIESDGQWAKMIEQFDQAIDDLKDHTEYINQEISPLSDMIFYECKRNNKSEGLKLVYEKFIVEQYLNSLEGNLDVLIENRIIFKLGFNKWISNPSDQMLLSYITKKANESNRFLEVLCKLLKAEYTTMNRGLNKKDDILTMFLID